MASQLRRLPVQLGPEFADKPVETSCAGPGPSSSEQPPFLLIHGFDSSCLEWRRLLPLLHAQLSMKHGIDGHNSTCTRGPPRTSRRAGAAQDMRTAQRRGHAHIHPTSERAPSRDRNAAAWWAGPRLGGNACSCKAAAASPVPRCRRAAPRGRVRHAAAAVPRRHSAAAADSAFRPHCSRTPSRASRRRRATSACVAVSAAATAGRPARVAGGTGGEAASVRVTCQCPAATRCCARSAPAARRPPPPPPPAAVKVCPLGLQRTGPVWALSAPAPAAAAHRGHETTRMTARVCRTRRDAARHRRQPLLRHGPPPALA